AFAALGERPTPFGFAGIALVSLGIMSLALRRGFRFSGEGVPYALLTGVFIAAYSICDGIGARESGSALGYIAWVYLLWSVPQLALVCALRGGPKAVFGSRATLRPGAIAGTISLAAYGIVIVAYRHLPVATVSALRETSSIFAVAIGWFAMRERPGVQRLVACALVVAGAALIRL
ncbi:DMT family transporter, partial [Burkholderia multivorans]